MNKRIIAKPVLEDKFWILERQGKRVATISCSGDQYMLSTDTETHFFTSFKNLKTKFGFDVEFSSAEAESKIDKSVHGYPTSCAPYNTMYDVKRKLPLFTKSTKSKSLYCAGYYIIHFDKGWVKSFCPKLITVERYETVGPFKTELAMRQELSHVNTK